MDILQQSLQAADILSGEESDDLFGELGLTFNNQSTETVGLPSELEELATQGDALYSNDSGSASRPNFQEFETSNDPMEISTFDTSQFLNTAAPVNAATTSQMPRQAQPPVSYVSPSNSQLQAVTNSLHSSKQQSYRDTSLAQFDSQLTSTVSYNNQCQNGHLARTLGMDTLQASTPVVLQTGSGMITTVAQSVSLETCSSVFSRAPSQSLTSTVQMKAATQSISINQPSLPGSIQLSTPIQMVQPSNALPQQANRQVVTLVQKPAMLQVNPTANHGQTNAQIINGIAVQPQTQNLSNVAVVKIAGVNRTLNLGDPKVVKALTANILQKQQTEAQNQQQVIKLGQNNALLNMMTQGSPQSAVLRGGQQITLQNGQTILLSNGQQVQISTSQPQAVQVLQPSSVAQSVTAAVRANQQAVANSLPQTSRNGQLPFKGIQIASVNIPKVSSSTITSATVSVPSVQGNIITIPVVGQTSGTTVSAVQAAVNSSPVTSASQMPNSSTVRSLLANAILKQNNNTSHNNSHSLSATQIQGVSAVSSQHVGTTQSQGPTMLRVNLTPQQLAQLTPVQLQAILKQHQLSMQTRAAGNSNSNFGTHGTTTVAQGNTEKPMQTTQSTVTPPILRTPVTAVAVANTSKPPSTEQSVMQVYKVDSTLTEVQVDEVKKLLANRTIASKLQCLTKEQQQLVLAFQAQIKTMSPPVQQYYLRNPQLFMQKVLQQIRAGKPFILQVKLDPQQRPRVVSTVNIQKQQHHPTISLTQDSNRASNRVNTPSPVTVQNLSAPNKTQPPIAPIQRPMPPSVKPTVHVPKQAVKRPLPPEHPAKVSLVLEQLDCHKRMVTSPDCTHAFRSVRDAIRRLVPFHTCNIPNVKEHDFSRSERIFDQIADRISAKTRMMMNKYHLLCLRDSTRDSCSAEMVMIERMFLQKEKVKFAEDKARLRDNPSLIKEYFPRRISNDENSAQSDDGDKSRHEAETTSVLSVCDRSLESPFSNDDASAISRNSEGSSDVRTDSRGRFSSHDSCSNVNNSKRLKHSRNNSFANEPRDVLLQEAVDSILI